MVKRSIIVMYVLLVCGCSGRPYAIENTFDVNAPKNNTVHVASHGWHTGFIVPASEANSIMPFLAERFSDAPFYEFGWGDEGFYQAGEVTTGLALKAVLWPTDAVVHVVSMPESRPGYFDDSDITRIKLSDDQLEHLLLYIKRSFYTDKNGRPAMLKQGLYGDSQFYKGEGRFHLFNTCNKWTAKGLKSTGMDIYPSFKLTAGSIMSFVQEHSEAATD